MSVPLEGLALHDTSDRVRHARIMAEYHKQAHEELKHIRAFQQQTEPTFAHPATPPTPLSTTQPPADPDTDVRPAAFPMPPGHTRPPLAAAKSLPATPTKTPRKPSSKIRGLLTRTPRKKDRAKDDFADVCRAMTSERLEPGRPRTADPCEGGQRPGEDSWEWYQRNMTALPPMPMLTHPAFRNEKGE